MNIGIIRGLAELHTNTRLKRKKDKDMVRASGLFIINKESKLLLAHPTNHSKNFWSIPKGRIEDGESAIVAAIRETQEEVNVDFKSQFDSDSLVYEEYPIEVYKSKKKSLQPFLVKEVDNPNIDFSVFELKCNSNVPEKEGGFPEMDDFKWVPIDEAISLVHHSQANVLKKIIK